MDLRNLLDETYGRNVFGFSEISIEKANNAKDKYAHNVDIKDIILLIDDTVFGSAKCGVLITSSGLYIGEDFEKPVYFSFDRMNSICMKRNVLGGLFIDNKKVKGFTQPEYKDLKLVFEKLNAYIDYYNSDNLFISIKDLPNTLDVSKKNKATDVNELKSDSINNQLLGAKSIVPSQEKEDMSSNSEFGIVKDYIVYKSFKELKNISDRDNVNSSLLFGNSRNPQAQIENITKAFIVENSILIRDKVLYGKGCSYFLDDFAFKECINLACSFLKFEFERVGFSTTQALEILDIGLKSIFKDDDKIIFSVKESLDFLDGNLIEVYIYSFYIRIYLLNTSLNIVSNSDSDEKSEIIRSIVLTSLLRSSNSILGDRVKTVEILTKLDSFMGGMPVIGLEMASNKAVKELSEIIKNFG